MRDHPDRIFIDNCRHAWLYRVYSRNLNLGVQRLAFDFANNPESDA